MTVARVEAGRPSRAGTEIFSLLSGEGLTPLKSLLDVGIGLTPQQYLPVKGRHVGLDAHQPYLDRLKKERPEIETVRHDLNDRLPFQDNQFQVVWMGDVIEHLEKEAGMALFEEAKRVASVGVVVRTPEGFDPQSEDTWGMGAEYWQTHRSGWTPEEFNPDYIWTVAAGVIKTSNSAWFQVFVRT
jgi:ubiquinone/menaquinone biosynthesis C-methylase UbiE